MNGVMVMKITVNSKEIEFEKSTLLDLLTLFRFKPALIAVHKNGELIPREKYAEAFLKDGDTLEIGRG